MAHRNREDRETFRIARRSLLAGGAAALGLGAFSAITRPAGALGRIDMGDGELTTVSDGHLTLPLDFAFPDVPQDELTALLSGADLPTDQLLPDCNVSVLRRGDRLVVFDVGAGPNFMPTAGDLPGNLAEAGIDPEDVTDVVFTHAHPDHLWGLIDDFDELVFPNAAYRMAEAEWDFWAAPETLDDMPEARKSFVVGAQNRFAAIDDQIIHFKPGDEVVPGVEAIGTPGHTPGHVSFMVHGAGDPVTIIGDAITNSVVSLAHPAWPTGSDQDPELGIKTRVALIDRLVADKAHVVGFHFPHPGGGRIEKSGTGYRFAPEA